jgi:hypothetical protein
MNRLLMLSRLAALACHGSTASWYIPFTIVWASCWRTASKRIRIHLSKGRRTMKPAKEISTEQNASNVGQQTGGWVLRLLNKIEGVSAAQEKWKALIAAGLDQDEQEELAENLFRFCGGSKEQLASGLKKARQFRDNLPSNILLFRQAATAAEAVIRDLQEIAGINLYFDQLPSLQRTFADEVEWAAGILMNHLARGVRVERGGNIKGGRGEALSIVIQLVDRITDHPYAMISPLVAAVRGDINPSYEYVADALRSDYNREWPKTELSSRGMGRKFPAKRTGRSHQNKTSSSSG